MEFKQQKFENRTKTDILADFYSLSMFLNVDDLTDLELSSALLPIVRREVLKAAGVGIISESLHSSPSFAKNIYHRFGVHNPTEDFSVISQNALCYYLSCKQRRVLPRYIAASKVLFYNGRWSPAYGGPNWGNICTKWLNLYNYHSKNYDISPTEMMVRIDQLIDCCHNTGNCLNKLWYRIDNWLTKKTLAENPFWIVDQCCFQKYASMRLKQQYGFTKEQFKKSKIR